MHMERKPSERTLNTTKTSHIMQYNDYAEGLTTYRRSRPTRIAGRKQLEWQSKAPRYSSKRSSSLDELVTSENSCVLPKKGEHGEAVAAAISCKNAYSWTVD